MKLTDELNLDSKITQEKEDFKEEYKTHYLSYIIITLYCIENYFMGTFLTSFGAVFEVFNRVYKVDTSVMSLTSSLLSLSFALTSIPFTFFSKSKGLRMSLILGLLFFVVGNILRLFINKSFVVFIIGFCFLGAGSPLIMNSQLKLVNSWVTPSKRNLVNALISVVSPIGAGTAQILPLFFIDTEETNIDTLKSQVYNFILFYVILMSIFLILNFIFIRDKPIEGYGLINEIKKQNTTDIPLSIQKKEFFKDLKIAIKEKKLIFSSLIYGMSLTTISILGTNINPILEPFGYSTDIGIIVSVVAILSGLIGAFIFSLFFQSKFTSKNSLLILFSVANIGIVLCPTSILIENKILLYIGALFLGGGVFSHCSVILEYCSKKFININPFVINSFLVIIQQIFQTIFIFLIGFVLSFEIRFTSFFSCFILQLFFFIIIILSLQIK